MRIKVLIYDNDATFVRELVHRIKTIRIPNHTFEICYEANPKEIEQTNFTGRDIVFLDACGGEYNGIELARKIRRLNIQAILIFIAADMKHSLEGYEVQAFRYLLKEQVNEKLEVVLKDACNEMLMEKKMFVFLHQGELSSIALEQIYYFESTNRIITPCFKNCMDQNFSFYSTMNQVEHDLFRCGFLRIHNSFLVNMEHIALLNCKGVTLLNGKKLPISRKNYDKIRAAYQNWQIYHA